MPAAPNEIRDYIATFFQDTVKQYAIKEVCDRLGMPPEGPDAWDYNSKRVYVEKRLASVTTEHLLEIARTVQAEYGDNRLEELLGGGGFRGVDGELKNLVFAAMGSKPRIVLKDAISNIIDIVEGADRCLIYDRPLRPAGLSWGDLVAWWGELDPRRLEPARSLYRRLRDAVGSPAEKLLLETYARRYGDQQVPALLPQVYLHYDPYTKREIARFAGKELPRQRMDFLLLMDERSRIVIEVDGKQHYSDAQGRAAPSLYAEMVREDRSIRLAGYEVFRFGGAELQGVAGERVVDEFFDALFERYGRA